MKICIHRIFRQRVPIEEKKITRLIHFSRVLHGFDSDINISKDTVVDNDFSSISYFLLEYLATLVFGKCVLYLLFFFFFCESAIVQHYSLVL